MPFENMENKAMSAELEALSTELKRRMPRAGRFPTAIPGVGLCRREPGNRMENVFHNSVIGMVVQGDKSSQVGDASYEYGAGQYLVMDCSTPTSCLVGRCSSRTPFLAVSIDLDKNLLSQLTRPSFPQDYGCHTESTDIVMSGEDEYLVDSFLRLIRLLDTPRDIPILAPVIIREIYGRIFWDPHRKMIYHSIYSMRKQYLKASVDYLKNNYMLHIDMNDLASMSNMAVSTFYRNFKHVFHITPLQYQKKLRLFEARRLMLEEKRDTVSAGLDVGYESYSQFSFEYKRMFGASPHTDIRNLMGQCTNKAGHGTDRPERGMMP